MRPYTPHIGPEVAQEVMILAADIVNKHGLDSATNLMDHAAAAWQATVTKIVYSNLVDNMEETKRALLADETKPTYSALCSQALDSVLAPLHFWTGHDWIGKVLGTVDATSEEALDSLFRAAARMVSKGGLEAGLKAKETLPKFLASEHITRKAIEEMIMPEMNENPVAVSEQDKPYYDFMKRLAEAAVPLLGVSGSDEKVIAAASGDEQAAKDLLMFAGYAGTSDELQSTLYGAKIYATAIALPAEATSPLVQENAQVNPVVENAPTAAVSPNATTFTAVQGLEYIRGNTGLKDTDMAELLEVSRGTIQNLVSGKAKKPMTQEGKLKLADRVDEIASGLADAAFALRNGQ